MRKSSGGRPTDRRSHVRSWIRMWRSAYWNMAQRPFKVGDRVRLKGGRGPHMSVTVVNADGAQIT